VRDEQRRRALDGFSEGVIGGAYEVEASTRHKGSPGFAGGLPLAESRAMNVTGDYRLHLESKSTSPNLLRYEVFEHNSA